MNNSPILPTLRRALFLLLAVFPATCQPPDQATPDPRGPETLVGEWVEMWNSYDLDEVSRLFVDDDRLTYFSSEREGVIRGFGELLEHHVGFGFVSGGKVQANRLWVEDLRTDLFGDVAVLTGIWFFQAGPGEPTASSLEGDVPSGTSPDPAGSQAAGSPSPQRGPVTFVCVREGDTWRFVHMNFSEYLPNESL